MYIRTMAEWIGIVAFMSLACGQAQAKEIGRVSQPQIVGGEVVSQGDPVATTTVALLKNGRVNCSASLIDDDLVLTAAHCVEGGRYSVSFSTRADVPGVIQKRALGIKVHPGYVSGANTRYDHDDIALILIERGLPAGYRKADLLPAQLDLRGGDPVLLAGYGATSTWNDNGTGILRKVQVAVKDPGFSRTEILLKQTTEQGACFGDSGGPAFLVQNGTHYLWGVTSRLSPDGPSGDCSNDSVYTKINSYLAWIDASARELRAGQ